MQPARQLRDGRGAQDGFLERFLLVYPECHRPRYRPVPISAAAREKWAAVINRLYGLKPATEAPTWTPRTVVLSADAGCHYEWAVNELRARMWDGPLRSVGRKFEAYLARLALVLHYLRWAECAGAEGARIDDADIEVAVALLGYFLAQAERVHRQLPVALNDDEADTVIRWAKRQERGDLKVRDLQRSNCLARRGFSVVGQYQTVLGRLADRGLIVWGDKGTTFRLPS